MSLIVYAYTRTTECIQSMNQVTVSRGQQKSYGSKKWDIGRCVNDWYVYQYGLCWIWRLSISPVIEVVVSRRSLLVNTNYFNDQIRDENEPGEQQDTGFTQRCVNQRVIWEVMQHDLRASVVNMIDTQKHYSVPWVQRYMHFLLGNLKFSQWQRAHLTSCVESIGRWNIFFSVVNNLRLKCVSNRKNIKSWREQPSLSHVVRTSLSSDGCCFAKIING